MPRADELRVDLLEEDGGRAGVTMAATVLVAKASPATGTPQVGQKRFSSAIAVPQAVQVDMASIHDRSI